MDSPEKIGVVEQTYVVAEPEELAAEADVEVEVVGSSVLNCFTSIELSESAPPELKFVTFKECVVFSSSPS